MYFIPPWLSGKIRPRRFSTRSILPFTFNYRVNMFDGWKPSTPWGSRAVPQLSTDLALHRLAMEFEWDPACSMQYGRRLKIFLDQIVRFTKLHLPDSHFYFRVNIILSPIYRYSCRDCPSRMLRRLLFLHLCRAPVTNRWIHRVLYSWQRSCLSLVDSSSAS